jgi:colicin import membrane protein
LTEKKPTKRTLPNVSTEVVTRKPDSTSQAKSAADAQAQQRADARARSKAIGSAVQSLREGLSNSTSVEMPGPGGAAYANYAQAVKSVYTQAWIVPEDLNDDEATTKVSVTIARDGTVLSSRVLAPSGNATMDGSIRRVLDRVRFVAPFPDGAKEAQRTFTINFNLKAKKLLG